MRNIVESIEGEYRRYKALGEGAIEQLTDDELPRATDAAGNSVATLVWHISGNLASRFTDFLQTDGEKPWRDRDTEFLPRGVPRAELLEEWDKGWQVLFGSLAELDDTRLHGEVTIRGVALTVHAALHRSLAHTSYHVGQIVLLARGFRGADWRSLSIPRGATAAYNQNPSGEKPPGPR